MIDRLSELDVPERLAGVIPRWVSQAAVAIVCIGVASMIRLVIDAVAPGAAPFMLLFPALLAATLLGGWPSGVAALLLGAMLVWRYVLGPAQHMAFNQTDVLSFLLFACSGGLIVAFTSVFRGSSRKMAAERQRRIDGRELLLREFNHRIKNDFQIIGSILHLQARRTQEPAARSALENAVERLQGVSQVHANLYATGQEATEIDLCDYLGRLCDGIRSSRLDGAAVTLRCEAASHAIHRDQAATLGLIVNELVTNAIKHAFPSGVGAITVRYEAGPGEGRLSVFDDGQGLPPGFDQASGVGRRLVEALARQTGGAWRWRSDNGAHFELELAAP